MNSLSEQLYGILQGCLKEHRDSQQALYDLFYALSLNTCIRYTSDEEDALEAVQDGFLKIFRHLGDFNQPEDENLLYPTFRGWVKKIMIYTAIDHYRAGKKHPFTLEITSEDHRPASGDQHPLDKLAYDELIGMVQALSPAYRAVFNLFVIDGFTHEEVAKTLGISIGTSKSNLAKARENLRNTLKKRNEAFCTRYE